jgi:hypothetical protein
MKFIVIGLPKTGKTMLVHTLNKVEEFRVLGEIFNTRDRSPEMPAHPHQVMEDIRLRDQKNNLHTWYCKKIGVKKFDITDDLLAGETFDLISQFLDTIFLPDKHCGFKLHHHHIELTPQLETYIAVHPTIKMVHCLRRNKIKQAIASIGNRFRGEMFECSPAGALDMIHDYEFRTKEIRRMFDYRENYKEIYYEDMTGDTDQSILDFTELNKFFGDILPEHKQIDTRKNTRNKISENLLNFDEFKNHFKGTIYERFID